MQNSLDFRLGLPNKEILAIGGSPRKRGNSDAVLAECVTGFDVKNEVIQLRELNFSACIGCERCRKDLECVGVKDDMQELYPKLIAAQGLVMVSPAHNYNVTALMKAFIDRMYTFYNFANDHPRSWSSQLAGQNRKAIIVAIGEQVHKEDLGFTLDGMRMPLEALGYEIVDSLEIYGVFERGKVKSDTKIMEKVKSMGQKLSYSLQ